MKALVLLATGFEEIEAVAPVDILRRAGVEVEVVSTTGDKVVVGAHAVPFVADVLLEAADHGADLVVLPGGIPGTPNLEANPAVIKLIEEFKAAGKFVAAICAAPMILGHLGYLEGGDFTCYPGCESGLKGKYTTNKTAVNGKVLTGKGPGAAIDFGLLLVEKLVNKAKADELKAALQY